MNKKQLTLQNSSLFAELERKAKELEILNIRLEESEKKAEALAEENEVFKESLEKADNENQKLYEKNKELEAALAEAKAKATASVVVSEPENDSAFNVLEAEDDQENPEATEIDLEIQQKIDEVAEMVENTEPVNSDETVLKEAAEENSNEPTDEPADLNSELQKTEIPEASFGETATEVLTPPTVEAKNSAPSLPTEDLLRDYGAKIIGKVTRVTAEVLSKVSAVNDDVAESLKTLALGKNESFKFQIMELAKRKTEPEKAMAEMDLLADEAIVYLRSI